MSPSSRQIFIWSLPTLFLLTFLWYKRKKSALQSDPGGTEGESKRATSNGTTVTTTAVIKPVVDIRKKSVVSEVKEENFEPRAVSSYNSQPSNNLSLAEELLNVAAAEEPQTPSQPEEINCVFKLSQPLTAENIERSSTSIVVEERLDLVIVEAVANEAHNNSNHVDQIVENLIDQEVCLEIVSATANVAVPIELQETLVTEEEEDRPITSNEEPVIETEEEKYNSSSEENIQKELLNLSLNSSWAAECELELDEESLVDQTIVVDELECISPQAGEMARELSSEVSLKAESPVEETRNGPLEESLEGKLSSLEIDEAEGKQMAVDNKVLGVKERNGERDSANHSPSEVMLGSPSMSNYSDVQSEGSSDSGKGCSDVATPPSRTPVSGSSVAGDASVTTVYEFVLPQLLVGRLIGRHGAFVQQIKTKTHASILIKRHPETHKLKICAIEGSQLDIENALEMIRDKFPMKRYPNVTLEQVSFASTSVAYPPVPESFQLQLIEGVNNDVILSSLVTPGHFFLQQPTHPTYPALNRLNLCMNYCYNESAAPALPSPIEASVICVAPTMGGWYRAQVMSSSADTATTDVKFIDYGGYQTVDNSLLRQIRSDFIALPFQAAECYLANVKPRDGVWPFEAMSFVEELTHGQVLQAQIYGYANDGVPVVFLYSIQGAQVLLVNRELVDRGYAEWEEPTEEVETTEMTPLDAVPISA